MKRLEPRASQFEGPRKVVRLDVAEASFPELLKGVNCYRIRLEPQGGVDGLRYVLSVDQRIRQSREQGGVVAIDLLTDLMNELGDALDADDVPQRLRDLWDELVGRYEARTSRRDPVTSETEGC